MKKKSLIPVFGLVFLHSIYLHAQVTSKCGTMQYLQQRMLQDPGLAAKMQANEIALQNEINLIAAKTTLTTYSIPVVVHVVWHTAAENISNAQVWSQIDALNEDYGRTNADTLNTPAAFQPVAANTNIQFCLAQADPNGNPSTGIEYVQTNVTSFPGGAGVTSTATGGADPWDTLHYLNIWVCNMSGGMLEVGVFPGFGTPGVIILYSAFGRTGNVLPPYNKGRIATHAIGHCLNLHHIWGDQPCGNDFVMDTPTQQQPNFGCPFFPQVTCSNGPNGDMFMNYMDYSDDICMNMFTQGQAVRMAAAINLFYPTLISSTSCSPSFTEVKGTVFYDANQNGVQDANDIGLNAQKITTLPDSNFYFTNYYGEYNSYFDTGTVNTIQFSPKPSWLLTSDSASYSVFTDSVFKCCYDFGTAPTVFFDSLEMGIGLLDMYCSSDNPVWLYYRNEGTTVASGIIKVLLSDSIPYLSASPPPSSFSGDTIVWNYLNLQPGEYRLIKVIVQGPVNGNVFFNTYAQIELDDNGSYILAAADSFQDFSICGFDPNSKEVNPPGIAAQHYTLKNIPLEYTIAFQNLGSGTAFNIILRDSLSSLLNRNTFQLLGYSHPVNVSVSSQNVAEFRFNTINLPPEITDETGSRGFVTFRIYPHPGLPDSTIINNDAAIYFDFNAPVITNNVFNTLVTMLPTGVTNISNNTHSVSISPVPFNNYFDITFKLDAQKRLDFSVYDTKGNIVFLTGKNFAKTNSHESLRINSKQWSKGIYFLKIIDENGSVFYSGKLLKE